MYSRKVVNSVLDDFARSEGWSPEYHTVEEVDEFSAYIDSITEYDVSPGGQRKIISWKGGKPPKESRRKWIRRWIENEQILCFADAKYFAEKYTHIRLADERIVHFDLRIAQQIFAQALAEAEEAQRAIQLYVLKCRQIGLSTVTAIYFLHRILFRPNTYAVMASVQHQQSEKLAGMIELALSRLPFWLAPVKTVLKAKEPKWENGSALSIQAGSQEVGIAQGTTPTCIHISEIGDYANPKRVLEEGLFPACHPTRSLFMVLEGTGATSTPWQKEKWAYYIDNWGKGGRFQPFFIPPACARDLYPAADWLRSNPIPIGWVPLEATLRMQRRGQLFVRSTEYLWKFLGQRWEMDKEFMWYWECGYREAVASHSERQFLAQMASTPDDAFQSENASAFSNEVIDIVTKNQKKDYLAYAITGRTILVGDENQPYQPDPEIIDQFGENIHLRWESADGNEYDWTLVPLKQFDDSDDALCFDKLLIFHPPEAGKKYAIGIDTAHGLNTPNEDRSALKVTCDGEGEEPDVQVASFTSVKVSSSQMARIAAAVAVLYGTDGHGTITSGNPLVVRFVIEQVRKAGDNCQDQLKMMGFFDHHPMHRYDKKGMTDLSKVTQLGWCTYAWSRSILLDRFVEAVNTGWLILNDPIVIRQLSTFERKYKGENGKPFLEHAQGCHDDDLFAMAMCWTTLHDLENTALRIAKKYKPPARVIGVSHQWCERVCQID